MSVPTLGSDRRRKWTALFTCLVLVTGAVPSLFAQESSGAIAGVILAPNGSPAHGFKVVLRDLASDTTFVSDPTDAQGNYAINVPVGGRYKVDSVVADDGVTKLAVQDVAPISVLAAGTTRLNVRFTSTPTPEEKAAGTKSADTDKKKGAAPWYRRPGPIVGLVLGAGAIAAIALSGGGSDSASPSYP